MFDAAYQELEKCLSDYIKRKNGEGWTEKVMAFQRDKLPCILSQRNIPNLINETHKLADSLRSTFDWMPCAAGSVLQIELKCFLLRVEREYRASLPQDPFIPVAHARRHSAPVLGEFSEPMPIPIPIRKKNYPSFMPMPSPEASPFVNVAIEINSKPYDCIKKKYKSV